MGTISSAIEIPANSLVRITGNLNIASTGSLTVHEGAVILIDEAVDINVSGPIVFVRHCCKSGICYMQPE